MEAVRKIETVIKEIIGSSIDPNDYIVVVKKEATGNQEQPASSDIKLLPYTSVTVSQQLLKKIMGEQGDGEAFSGNIVVEVIFDESVSDSKQQIISDKIREALSLNSPRRTLNSRTSPLNPVVSREDSEQEKLEKEIAELEVERTKLELEREKFEAARREDGLRDEINQTSQRLDDLKKDLEEEKERVDEELKKKQKELDEKLAAEQKKFEEELEKERNKEAGKSFLELAKDFQLSAVAALLAIIGLIAILIAASSHKKGLSALSEALKEAADSFKEQPAQKEESSSGDVAASEDTEKDRDSGAGAIDATLSAEDEKDEDHQRYLSLVEEKIEIMSEDGNFSFFRHFLDLFDSNLAFAASILVSLKDEIAKKLFSNLSSEYLSKVRNYLSEPGALSRAKKMRGQALQDFHSRIAIDEFTDSPLLGIKNAEWIMKLATIDLRALAISLGKEERTAFLACFTPTRVALIIKGCEDDDQRQQLIDSIRAAKNIGNKDLEGLFSKLSSNEILTKQQEAPKLIDAPSFYAKVLTDLNPASREDMIAALSDDAELMEKMKDYYIPFTAILQMAPSIVKEIFGSRPASQVALIVFTSSQELRDWVIAAMPEQLRDTVQEELEIILGDGENEKKNRMDCLKIQGEISKHLLRLHKEGLLEYRENTAVTENETAA